jgi:hypothetical protein
LAVEIGPWLGAFVVEIGASLGAGSAFFGRLL